jgi:hypothetical protein
MGFPQRIEDWREAGVVAALRDRFRLAPLDARRAWGERQAA